MTATREQRLRLWNLARWVCFVVFLASAAVLIALIPLGNQIPPWLWGPAIGGATIGGLLGSVANLTYRDVLFGEAHRAVGVVTEAVDRAAGDYAPWVEVSVDSVLADGTTIHRRLDVGGQLDAAGWLGREIHFRHLTDDPHQLTDAYYGDDERDKTLGRDT